MNVRYQHTQNGYLIQAALVLPPIVIIYLLVTRGLVWALVFILVVDGLLLLLFSSLTVTIDDEHLYIRFGIGVIQKDFPLREVASCQIVRNPWYWGWGIHRIPGGWLYNVSGFRAVEVVLRNGRRCRVGTDVPQELVRAIERACATQRPSAP